jgi:hypothetical protein
LATSASTIAIPPVIVPALAPVFPFAIASLPAATQNLPLSRVGCGSKRSVRTLFHREQTGSKTAGTFHP